MTVCAGTGRMLETAGGHGKGDVGRPLFAGD
jgi:hypothetical protein